MLVYLIEVPIQTHVEYCTKHYPASSITMELDKFQLQSAQAKIKTYF